MATLEWVAWFNQERLLELLGYVPPAEFEAQYCDTHLTHTTVGGKLNQTPGNPAWFSNTWLAWQKPIDLWPRAAMLKKCAIELRSGVNAMPGPCGRGTGHSPTLPGILASADARRPSRSVQVVVI